MKKQILILLVLPLLFSCGEKKKIKTDLTLSGINGKVKEIMWAEFNVKEAFGEIKKDSLISKYKIYYNVQGNQSSWNQYNTNKLIAKGITEFNEFNKCSEYTTYNGEGELTQKKKYIYDKNKNKIETNIYNEDGSLSSKYIYI